MNYLLNRDFTAKWGYTFPSPTGVNYYEHHDTEFYKACKEGFRPQQGLTIMNLGAEVVATFKNIEFPSPTGVNYYEPLGG